MEASERESSALRGRDRESGRREVRGFAESSAAPAGFRRRRCLGELPRDRSRDRREWLDSDLDGGQSCSHDVTGAPGAADPTGVGAQIADRRSLRDQ